MAGVVTPLGSSVASGQVPMVKEPSAPGGIAVGAVIVHKSEAQRVRGLLRNLVWLRKGKNVTPGQQGHQQTTDGKTLALHLNHRGASQMPRISDLQGQETLELAKLMKEGQVSFIPGLRMGMNIHDGLDRPTEEDLKGARFTFVELFAGMGGFRVGLEAIGGASAFASEIDTEAQDLYCNNFQKGVMAGDITRIYAQEVPPHDMLTAGFCCQSFSKAGEQAGFDDDRGRLFFEIGRILRGRQPATFLLENVANLMQHDDGNTMQGVMDELKDAGYRVTHRVINSSALVPQHRQRLYFVGFRNDLPAEFERFRWPELPLLGRTVADILEPPGPETERARLSENQWAKISSSDRFKSDPGMRAAMRHGPSRTLMSSYVSGCYFHSEFVFEPEVEFSLDWSGSGPTCPVPRFYTPREAARLQGYPESFDLCSTFQHNSNRIYHSLGNSVSPPVIAAIGEAIMRAMEGLSDDSSLHNSSREALSLVMASCPAARENPSQQDLSQRIGRFLSGEEAIPCYGGYNEDVADCGGPEPLLRLLDSPGPRARMVALRDISQTTHERVVGPALAGKNATAIASWPGLLDRMVEVTRGCMDEAAGELSRERSTDGGSEQSRNRGQSGETLKLGLVALTHLAEHQPSMLRTAGVVQLFEDVASGMQYPANLHGQARTGLAVMDSGGQKRPKHT